MYQLYTSIKPVIAFALYFVINALLHRQEFIDDMLIFQLLKFQWMETIFVAYLQVSFWN